jgi:hypothetical protein
MEARSESRENIRGVAVPVCILAVLLAGWVILGSSTPKMKAVAAQPPAQSAPAQSAPVQSVAAYSSSSKIVFNRDIRPILADRCFSCHGPDPNKRQAGLRLDRPNSATGPLPKHPQLRAFVPGHPELSEALKRVLTDDKSPRRISNWTARRRRF